MKAGKAIVGALCLLLGGSDDPKPVASSSAAPLSADPCVSNPCRDATTITLSAGENSELRFDVPHSPYLTSEGHIVIRPKETLVFRFPLQTDGPGTPQFIRAEAANSLPAPDMNDPAFSKLDKTDLQTQSLAAETQEYKAIGDPKSQIKNEPIGTLIVTLRQITGNAGMVLDITQNFPHALTLDAFIMVTDSGKWRLQHTSTCPVLPNLRDIEVWPDTLGGIILEHFRYSDEGDVAASGKGTSIVCR